MIGAAGSRLVPPPEPCALRHDAALIVTDALEEETRARDDRLAKKTPAIQTLVMHCSIIVLHSWKNGSVTYEKECGVSVREKSSTLPKKKPSASSAPRFESKR